MGSWRVGKVACGCPRTVRDSFNLKRFVQFKHTNQPAGAGAAGAAGAGGRGRSVGLALAPCARTTASTTSSRPPLLLVLGVAVLRPSNVHGEAQRTEAGGARRASLNATVLFTSIRPLARALALALALRLALCALALTLPSSIITAISGLGTGVGESTS